jgi:hypothetical protein
MSLAAAQIANVRHGLVTVHPAHAKALVEVMEEAGYAPQVVEGGFSVAIDDPEGSAASFVETWAEDRLEPHE